MFRPLVEVSQQSLDANSKPTSSGCDPLKARAYAIALLGSYRSTEVDDPAVYAANSAAVLCRYPEHIVAEVCGPGTGIQTRQKWLPTVSELHAACEQALGEQVARERRELLAKHRVLIDTPYGPKPEEEAARISQEARDRAVARWEEIKAGFEGEKRRKARARRLEELQGQPVPGISAKALEVMHRPSIDRGPATLEVAE
jgi:hypothetical protein